MTDAIPPQALDYEYAVVGAMHIDPRIIQQIKRRLKPEMFYRDATRKLYETAVTLHDAGRPVDLLTMMTEACGDDLNQHADLRRALLDAGEACAASCNGWYYAEEVRRTYIERQAIKLCERAIEKLGAMDPAHILGIVQEQAAKLKAELDAEDGTPSTTDMLNEILDELDGSALTDRLPCGVPGITSLVSGWNPGELIVVGAATSTGKTSILVQMMQASASIGRPVLFVSAEMPAKQIMKRLLSQVAGVSYQAVDGEASLHEATAIGHAAQAIAGWPMRVIPPPNRKASTVVTCIERERPAIAVVDYLQLLQGEGENRTQKIGDAIAQLKQAALTCKCPVIVASQVSRSAMQESGGRPRLHHLRESGDIENHTDVVLMLWRDKDEMFTNGKTSRNIAVEKQRNGPTGSVVVTFNGICARWEDNAQ